MHMLKKSILKNYFEHQFYDHMIRGMYNRSIGIWLAADTCYVISDISDKHLHKIIYTFQY